MKGIKSFILIDNSLGGNSFNALCVATTEEGLCYSRIVHYRDGKEKDQLWLFNGIKLEGVITHIQEYKRHGFKLHSVKEF